MASYLVQNDGVSKFLLNATGAILLNGVAAFTAKQRRTSGFMTVRVGSRAVLTLLIVAVFLCF